MVNRLKGIIDLTKSISEDDMIHFHNGIVYTVGKNQLFQAYTDITEDKLSIKSGLTEMSFSICISKFLEFEKRFKEANSAFKKSHSKDEEFLIPNYDSENNVLRLNTVNQNLSFESNTFDSSLFKTWQQFFADKDNLDEDECLFEAEIDEEGKRYLTANPQMRMYLNIDTQSIEFSRPSDDCCYLMLSFILSYLPKINNSDTKSLKISVYQWDSDNIYLVKLNIQNKNYLVTSYSLSVDSVLEEEGGNDMPIDVAADGDGGDPDGDDYEEDFEEEVEE